MRPAASAIAALTAAVLLAACAGPGDGVIYHRHVEPNYQPSSFWTQSAGRDLKTEIYGNPFAVDHEALARAVTTAMHGAHFGPETNFVEVPGENNAYPYHVRLLFNAPPTNGMSICSAPSIEVPPTAVKSGAGGVRVGLQAAYCIGNSRITSLDSGVDGITGPDDPAFVAFIRQVTAALFPPYNPGQNSDRCFVPNC